MFPKSFMPDTGLTWPRWAPNSHRLNSHADWDPEAEVWVATSDDVPGLATEAETIESLTAKLRIMVPELLEANYGLRLLSS